MIKLIGGERPIERLSLGWRLDFHQMRVLEDHLTPVLRARKGVAWLPIRSTATTPNHGEKFYICNKVRKFIRCVFLPEVSQPISVSGASKIKWRKDGCVNSLSIRLIQNPRLTNEIVETGILALESQNWFHPKKKQFFQVDPTLDNKWKSWLLVSIPLVVGSNRINGEA